MTSYHLPRGRGALCWLAIAAGAVLGFLEARPGNIDDAFILLVYVRHLATHGAFYYNRLDGAIDGFTSPLDLLLKTGVWSLVRADPIGLAWAMSLLFQLAVGLFGGFLGWWLIRRYQCRRPMLLLLSGGLLFATNQALCDGSAFLLETPLTVLLALVVTTWAGIAPPSTVKARILWATLLVLLCLSRPEGLVLSFVLLVLVYREERSLVPLLVFATAMGCYYCWRVSTFGYWAPNTYYAKTSASRWNEIRDGFRYTLDFAQSAGAPVLLWTLAAPCFAGSARFVDPKLHRVYLTGCVAAWATLAAVIFSGGDCYHGGRFLAVPLVLSLIALLVGSIGLVGRAKRIAQATLGLSLAIQVGTLIATPIARKLNRDPPLFQIITGESSFECDRETSALLAKLMSAKPGGVIAQTDYQRLKYFQDDLQVLDLTGLNDRAIAHRPVAGPVRWGKTDLLEAARLAPEVILLGHRMTPREKALGEVALPSVMEDPAQSDDYFGWEMNRAVTDALAPLYDGASLRVCGGYFNFLARHDRAPVFRERGAIIRPR